MRVHVQAAKTNIRYEFNSSQRTDSVRLTEMETCQKTNSFTMTIKNQNIKPFNIRSSSFVLSIPQSNQ